MPGSVETTIINRKTGEEIAGLRAGDNRSFRDTEELMYVDTRSAENKFTGNTTIGGRRSVKKRKIYITAKKGTWNG